MSRHEPLELLRVWEGFTDELFGRTAGFPRAARYSLSARLDNLALDVLEGLVEAQYTKGPRRERTLQEINLRLSRLRILLRMAHRRSYLSHGAYEHTSRQVDEAGRMVGGWLKSITK